ALPLGYRLKHVGPGISGDCLWCPGEQQTREHFITGCEISKEIWGKGLSHLSSEEERTPPTTLEEIYQEPPTENPNGWYAKMWLSMNVVYELWCNYTAGRWGKDLSDKNIM
ncbi:4375_t:CDS:1, partial [Paraglomus brasilianum]